MPQGNIQNTSQGDLDNHVLTILEDFTEGVVGFSFMELYISSCIIIRHFASYIIEGNTMNTYIFISYSAMGHSLMVLHTHSCIVICHFDSYIAKAIT